MLCSCLPDRPQSEVAILAQEQVYVQWRKARKLELVVGGQAYLLPWTTLLLRCPTRHFRKGHVQWLKDGRPLAGVPQASVSALGHLKVQQVRGSHAGTYTCVAGPARQNFTLQVIGSKKKLPALERHLVEQLLQLRSSLDEDQQDQQDQGSGLSSLLVLADPSRLDQLLSDGALGGPQLLRLLTAPRGGANQSTLAPLPDRAKIKAQTPKSRSPVMVQLPLRPQVSAQVVVVGVGAPVLLQRPVSSLELRCEVQGDPEPSLTWTKDGTKLQQNSR